MRIICGQKSYKRNESPIFYDSRHSLFEKMNAFCNTFSVILKVCYQIETLKYLKSFKKQANFNL